MQGMAAPSVCPHQGFRHGHLRPTRSPLHLVSALASGQRFGLGQEAVAANSNEITAIPLLLNRLELADQTVTIDALGCQRRIAVQIVGQGGHYALALMANQPELLEEMIASFTVATSQDDRIITIRKDHGRDEIRVCETISDPAVLAWLDPDDLVCLPRRTVHVIPGRGQPGGAQSLEDREQPALGP